MIVCLLMALRNMLSHRHKWIKSFCYHSISLNRIFFFYIFFRSYTFQRIVNLTADGMMPKDSNCSWNNVMCKAAFSVFRWKSCRKNSKFTLDFRNLLLDLIGMNDRKSLEKMRFYRALGTWDMECMDQITWTTLRSSTFKRQDHGQMNLVGERQQCETKMKYEKRQKQWTIINNNDPCCHKSTAIRNKNYEHWWTANVCLFRCFDVQLFYVFFFPPKLYNHRVGVSLRMRMR